jgi:hypothetical protein
MHPDGLAQPLRRLADVLWMAIRPGDGLLLRQSDHLDPAVGQHLLINDRTAIGGMTS